MKEMEAILAALSTLRAPLQQGEYDLHALVMDCLRARGIAFEHERRLGPRCRIDLLAGSVGIEIKKGRPEIGRLREQLRRYAASEEISGLIVVSERNAALPQTIGGKPLRLVCLNRLWGIAL